MEFIVVLVVFDIRVRRRVVFLVLVVGLLLKDKIMVIVVIAKSALVVVETLVLALFFPFGLLFALFSPITVGPHVLV